MTVHALVEQCGGKVTSAVSGVTDYLVCGTVHFNPFLGTRGRIEDGSKYKKAITCPKCKIISYEQLMLLCKSQIAKSV
jgi:NAD-dependent DNA ligase